MYGYLTSKPVRYGVAGLRARTENDNFTFAILVSNILGLPDGANGEG